jgi:hypothetical protein
VFLLENSKSHNMKKRTDNFDKFANQKRGSAIKEEYRQQKKKLKQEARAAGEEMRKKKLDKKRGVQDEAPKSDARATGKKDAGFRKPGPGSPKPAARPGRNNPEAKKAASSGCIPLMPGNTSLQQPAQDPKRN